MRKLILVRHSLPEIIPDLPANQWSLSEAGRQRCTPLADRLAAYHPDLFVTSTEPKAIETGQIAAGLLDKPCLTATGLHEHDRQNVPFESKEQFEAAIARLFIEPGSLVFGNETADQARQRLKQATASVMDRHPNQNVALVTHGTVMTLFVAQATGLEPLPFWKRLGLPAFVVLSWPRLDLMAVSENVE